MKVKEIKEFIGELITLEDGTTKIQLFSDLKGYLLDDSIFVPINSNNRHYQEIQQWIKEGNQPEPAYTLDEIKTFVKNKIRSIRQEKENQGIILVIDDIEYPLPVNDQTQTRWQGVIMSFELGLLNKDTDTILWKFTKELWKELTYTDFITIGGYMKKYIQQLFIAEKQHYDNVDNINALEELEQYNFYSNWPDNTFNL